MSEKKRKVRRGAKKTGHGGPGLDSSYPVGLALSGGGHRATLFGLGVLMAMRDAGKRPRQIASVSGGSITNAVLAYNYYSKVTPEHGADEDEAHWQQETRSLLDMVVNHGIVTKSWIRALMLFAFLPPLGFVVLAFLESLPKWYITIPIALVWLTALLLRGMLVELLISKRCFNRSLTGLQLEKLHNQDVEHVICCTDLLTGRPLYFSTRDRGCMFRRFKDRPAGVGPRTTIGSAERSEEIKNMGVLYSAPALSVAAAVRASAGFPGIPPRHIPMSSLKPVHGDEDKGRALPNVAFLSDGGIWNNLATQPYEDGFLWGTYGPWVVVVADASAPLDYIKRWGFAIPGLAELQALIRQATIQNVNTVGPRRLNYDDWIRRELSSHRSARFTTERLYPVISCGETPQEVRKRLTQAIFDEHANDGFLDGSEREWRNLRREKTRMRIRCLDNPSIDLGVSATPGDTDPNAAQAFRRLCDLAIIGCITDDNGERDPVASYPTTLDRVDLQVALAIVRRGYANTAITLYLTGLADTLVFPKGWLAWDGSVGGHL